MVPIFAWLANMLAKCFKFGRLQFFKFGRRRQLAATARATTAPAAEGVASELEPTPPTPSEQQQQQDAAARSSAQQRAAASSSNSSVQQQCSEILKCACGRPLGFKLKACCVHCPKKHTRSCCQRQSAVSVGLVTTSERVAIRTTRTLEVVEGKVH